jgi:hypothetical protein
MAGDSEFSAFLIAKLTLCTAKAAAAFENSSQE